MPPRPPPTLQPEPSKHEDVHEESTHFCLRRTVVCGWGGGVRDFKVNSIWFVGPPPPPLSGAGQEATNLFCAVFASGFGRGGRPERKLDSRQSLAGPGRTTTLESDGGRGGSFDLRLKSPPLVAAAASSSVRLSGLSAPSGPPPPLDDLHGAIPQLREAAPPGALHSQLKVSFVPSDERCPKNVRFWERNRSLRRLEASVVAMVTTSTLAVLRGRNEFELIRGDSEADLGGISKHRPSGPLS